MVFLATGGKPYYAGPSHVILLAGGAVLAERLLDRISRPWTVVGIVLLASQAVLVPFFLPVLAPSQLAEHLDQWPHGDWKKGFGWEDLVDQTASAYGRLSSDETSGLRILTDNYGAAGAIDILGSNRGLPAAVSGHNGYAFWEDSPTLDPLLVIGYDPDAFGSYYREVRSFGVVENRGLFPNSEVGDPLFYCAGLKVPAQELWDALRHFD